MPHHLLPPPVVPISAADVAFFAVFGVFVVAFVVLSVITLRWAIRRDRAGRAAWRERMREREVFGGEAPGTNGRGPDRGSRFGGG